MACARPCGRAETERSRWRPAASRARTPAATALVTADTVTVELPLSLPAQLYVEHDAAIYARSPGIVEAILADLGSRVAAGQLLARLESADQAIALAQARDRHARRRQCRPSGSGRSRSAGVVTQADSEQVEFELRAAALALQKAQRDYDLTRIVAPFAGVVTGRSARIGRLVTDGDSLFHLTALVRCWPRSGCPRLPPSGSSWVPRRRCWALGASGPGPG